MDFLANLGSGFGVALTPWNLVYAFVARLIGTAIGVLPGLGPPATIALLLPVTYGMDATSAVIMLSGIFYGAQYGGSTTSILSEYSRGGGIGGDLPGRVPDGAPGARGTSVGHVGDGFVRWCDDQHRADVDGGAGGGSTWP